MTFSAQAVDFRVQGLDNLGIDYVSILLDRPVLDGRGWWQWQLIYIGNNFYAGSSTDTFTDNTPATANSTYEVSSNALPGAYNVMGVDVHDISGSVKSYSKIELDDLGFNTQFVVSNGTFVPTVQFIQTSVPLESNITVQLEFATGIPVLPTSPMLKLTFNYTDSYITFDHIDGSFDISTINTSSNGATGSVSILAGLKMNDTNIATITFHGAGTGSGTFNIDVSEFQIGNYNVIYKDPSPIQFDFARQIIGTSGNDTFHTWIGNEHVDGREGTDTQIFSGKEANYTIAQTGKIVTVTDKVGTDGIDTLINVEKLQFSDHTLAIEAQPGQTLLEAYRIYKAAFDRAPDYGGLGFWYNAMDHGGASLADVAGEFIKSTEFKAMYGDNSTDANFINLLYSHVLGRIPDQGGYDFWINALHTDTRANILVQFSESAENIANIAGIVANGIIYETYTS